MTSKYRESTTFKSRRFFRHIVTDVIACEPRLGGLFRVSKHFARWHLMVQQRLPAAWREGVRLVCARGDTVVFYVNNGMIADKLRQFEPTILRVLAEEVRLSRVVVHVREQKKPPPKVKTLTISATARQRLQQAAMQIDNEHLRAAMLRLARVNLDADEIA